MNILNKLKNFFGKDFNFDCAQLKDIKHYNNFISLLKEISEYNKCHEQKFYFINGLNYRNIEIHNQYVYIKTPTHLIDSDLIEDIENECEHRYFNYPNCKDQSLCKSCEHKNDCRNGGKLITYEKQTRKKILKGKVT